MARQSKDCSEAHDRAAERYDDELLSANWNPVIDVLQASCRRTAADASSAQRDLREEDVEAFLRRIYRAG